MKMKWFVGAAPLWAFPRARNARPYRAVIFFIILLAILSSCTPTPQGTPVQVFYAVRGYSSGVLGAETKYAPGGDLKLFVLRTMAAEPSNAAAYRSVFPDNVVIEGIHMEDGVAVVTLSEEYSAMIGLTRPVLEYALLQTLFQFEDVTGLCIAVGEERGDVLRADSFASSPPRIVRAQQEILLYFASPDGLTVQPERRTVILRESESTEWYQHVVEVLIAGPAGTELHPVMPLGTRLLSISMESKTCIVNLSGEFVSAADGTPESARLTLLAIVNSLTELSGVSFVRLRVEGEDITSYFGYDLTPPLQRGAEELEGMA